MAPKSRSLSFSFFLKFSFFLEFFLFEINNASSPLLSPLYPTTSFAIPIFECANIYSTARTREAALAWCPCGPEKKAERQRGSEGVGVGRGGSSSRLTRADLIKLPVTLTNLLVLSHCVESSPPLPPMHLEPSTPCPSFQPPPLYIHTKRREADSKGKMGAINVI